MTSLRARLLVPTLTVMVIVTFAAAALAATMVARHLSGSFRAQAEHSVGFVAKFASSFFTNYDVPALGEFVKEMSRDKQVVFAEFLDAQGKSMTADVLKPPADLAGLFVVARDVKSSSGRKVGSVRAGYRDDTGAAARDLVLNTVGGGMLTMLLAVVGMLLWAVRYVMRVIGAEPTAAVAVADSIAAGDLTHSVSVAAGDTSSLLSALSRMQQQLRDLVGEIRHTGRSIGASCGEIAQGHVDLSSRSEEQASSLEQTAATIEQVTATVSQNAENARNASNLAAGASAVAVRGGQAVEAVVSTMTGISDSSRKIADIIGVIDGIAFQTNILALNAAVEAARAGEQGRGFAVVASEVRSLAQRSATAAKEIRQLIANSVERIDAGSSQVEEAGRTMGEIVASVKQVTGLIAEISAASQEQSQSLAQVSNAATQLEQVTQQNAAMVEQATAASRSLEEQAVALMRAVDNFKLTGEDAQAAPAAAAVVPWRG